jgi:hypothetical protein
LVSLCNIPEEQRSHLHPRRKPEIMIIVLYNINE